MKRKLFVSTVIVEKQYKETPFFRFMTSPCSQLNLQDPPRLWRVLQLTMNARSFPSVTRIWSTNGTAMALLWKWVSVVFVLLCSVYKIFCILIIFQSCVLIIYSDGHCVFFRISLPHYKWLRFCYFGYSTDHPRRFWSVHVQSLQSRWRGR